MNGLEGSIAITPTVSPDARKWPASRSMRVLFPLPGGPVIPIRRAEPMRAWMPASMASAPGEPFSTREMARASAAGFLAVRSSSMVAGTTI